MNAERINTDDMHEDERCLAYLSGDLDDHARESFESKLASDSNLSRRLLHLSETWVLTSESFDQSRPAPVKESNGFYHVAVAIAASVALFVFSLTRLGNQDDAALVAQAWAEQAASGAQSDSDVVDIVIADKFESIDLDSESIIGVGDTFDWMLVAVSDQWESDQQKKSKRGSSNES